MITRQSTL